MSRDKLVSTAILREKRQALRDQIAEQKRFRPDNDPFFRATEWLLAEWEAAEKEAAREYVSTAEAVRLTGWSGQTLRKRADAARSGDPLPEGWENLQARKDGAEWCFVVSTVPVKGKDAAA